MKNNSLILLGFVLLYGMVSCNNETVKNPDEKTDAKVNLTGDSTTLKIAFYYLDSVATQFNYYKQVDSMLRAKESKFQTSLQNKLESYRAYEANVQKKIQNYEITGYQLDDVRKSIMQKQQALQNYRLTQGTALQQEAMAYQIALMNKIADAGKEFSTENGIDVLFFYQKGGQITYINNAYDVTQAFIDYLNQREEELKSDIKKEVEELQSKDQLSDPLNPMSSPLEKNGLK